MPFFGNIQEHSAGQLRGIQGSGNLFHEFKVRQMRLNERRPDAKAMITKEVVSGEKKKKQNVLNLFLNKSHPVPTYLSLLFPGSFHSSFLM